MKINSGNCTSFRVGSRASRLGFCVAIACGFLLSPALRAAETSLAVPPASAVQQMTFKTPEEASEALIHAAGQFDVAVLIAILGTEGEDLVASGDPVQDQNQAAAFAEQARVKTRVLHDSADPRVATLVVGAEDWPMPIPIVEKGGQWRFDSAAGRTEILYRRIGRNELDAIESCHGYVAAQHEYALQRHEGSMVNQYAQRIISTPGKQDGLVWRDAGGAPQGPMAEGLARVIAEGYTERYDPYHGYYFKILKGQGPAAPLGELDYVVEGVMIGGFALVAAPAEYEVTGVKTFIVSNDGVVYEKDFGAATLEQFRKMELFNPDSSWEPVASP
jgi:Protein of unknown function (DUF2950)